MQGVGNGLQVLPCVMKVQCLDGRSEPILSKGSTHILWWLG
jgi:hypothetical protein